ncbi:hypothetical protein [Rugosimonospora africana]|uniref:Uncharacterized protein n=1 Tax=Rugosimonospora africana TaxID=556532 RepID=A0A8J3QYA6_9ACTN|nr:hypothetical protein [Rugosimonospora africana]GIH19459.1 hypothetical protein Raf01_76310 [Rugosimonospora africana]
MTASPPSPEDYWQRRPPASARVLMAFTAAAFAVVSVVHFGVDVPIGFATISDSFPGAAPPEAVIAAVVAIGAVAAFAGRTRSRGIALATTAFALLGTAYGLRITVNSPRTGDVIYHLTVLATLLVTFVLLLMPGRSRARPVGDARNEVRSST